MSSAKRHAALIRAALLMLLCGVSGSAIATAIAIWRLIQANYYDGPWQTFRNDIILSLGAMAGASALWSLLISPRTQYPPTSRPLWIRAAFTGLLLACAWSAPPVIDVVLTGSGHYDFEGVPDSCRLGRVCAWLSLVIVPIATTLPVRRSPHGWLATSTGIFTLALLIALILTATGLAIAGAVSHRRPIQLGTSWHEPSSPRTLRYLHIGAGWLTYGHSIRGEWLGVWGDVFPYFSARPPGNRKCYLGLIGCESWVHVPGPMGDHIEDTIIYFAPVWLVSLSLLPPIALVSLKIARMPRRGRTGACRRCSYLLYGLSSNRCPECGTPFSAQQATRTSHEPAPA